VAGAADILLGLGECEVKARRVQPPKNERAFIAAIRFL
jgi:hypothetical protein